MRMLPLSKVRLMSTVVYRFPDPLKSVFPPLSTTRDNIKLFDGNYVCCV